MPGIRLATVRSFFPYFAYYSRNGPTRLDFQLTDFIPIIVVLCATLTPDENPLRIGPWSFQKRKGELAPRDTQEAIPGICCIWYLQFDLIQTPSELPTPRLHLQGNVVKDAEAVASSQ